MYYMLEDQTFLSLALPMILNFCETGIAQLYVRYLTFYRSVENGVLETSRKTIQKEVAAGLTIVQELQHNNLGLK